MSLNRDLAVLFSATYFPANQTLRVCDPTTASGIRAVRYALEVPNVLNVVAADRDADAVALASKTVMLNKLLDKVVIVASDANLLLLSQVNERFDIVDLDPFGSPAPFFESSLKATKDEGILAATATDMGPLSGARPAACFRKYGIHSVRTEFEKEMAVRILAGCLVNVGQIGTGRDDEIHACNRSLRKTLRTREQGEESSKRIYEKTWFPRILPHMPKSSSHPTARFN